MRVPVRWAPRPALIAACALLVLSVGCTHTVERCHDVEEEVPYEDWGYETRTRTVPYNQPVSVDEYELAPPYFPYLHDRRTRLAVLKFDESVRYAGAEIAKEVQYELFKRAERWKGASTTAMKRDFYLMIESRQIGGITKQDVDRWFVENRHPKYEILDRTNIDLARMERELSPGNFLERWFGQSNSEVSGIDGLVVGHVRDLSHGHTSFIIEVIDVKSTKSIFMQRYEGGYEEAVNAAVDDFFYNIKRTGEKTTVYKEAYREESYRERVRVTKYEKKTVKKCKDVKEIDWVITVIFAVLAYAIIAEQSQ